MSILNDLCKQYELGSDPGLQTTLCDTQDQFIKNKKGLDRNKILTLLQIVAKALYHVQGI